ncbi:hypothetical protein ANCDUO_07767 [Ancylostoma duodenale]|uniref:Uncharacterized protein n=1 Tax=Ancylostoma duodenale TaxID=51022 RepID=A0A0C2DHM5_9BILA|nr:hypothetical protein ANCDUO_07767 [Ancylostoma duodenale]
MYGRWHRKNQLCVSSFFHSVLFNADWALKVLSGLEWRVVQSSARHTKSESHQCSYLSVLAPCDYFDGFYNLRIHLIGVYLQLQSKGA